MDPSSDLPEVAAVRRFNRLYTKTIGVLDEGYLDSPFSLTESRILYELGQSQRKTASDLAQELGLDPGYLSRILRGFEHQELIEKTRSETDGRQYDLALTGKGREAFARLNEGSVAKVSRLLEELGSAARREVVGAMGAIEQVLSPAPAARTYVLRSHQAGDLGWIAHRHCVLYAREYGWGEKFEALVAGVVAAFGKSNDPQREHCWIAERDGRPVGSIVLVATSAPATAQLRMLLVEPEERGSGVGRRLVDECLRFARQAGYTRVTLWTHEVLTAARKIYVRAGFKLIHSEVHNEFGPDVASETWERDL